MANIEVILSPRVRRTTVDTLVRCYSHVASSLLLIRRCQVPLERLYSLAQGPVRCYVRRSTFLHRCDTIISNQIGSFRGKNPSKGNDPHRKLHDYRPVIKVKLGELETIHGQGQVGYVHQEGFFDSLLTDHL